jgi:hypothetical protein
MDIGKELEKQRKKVDTAPSEAAAKAGNYSKGFKLLN